MREIGEAVHSKKLNADVQKQNLEPLMRFLSIKMPQFVPGVAVL
ncbi:hypothetical protein L798_07502 [Zootermopsis nevadensis]|uniref:Uncharacterized protein n=1 Tax=Zootermopsis nevadensis TaxID=136037 RepID=A0A067R3M4_ZOONE|nr:hypothetical protein L798_07502 [Zootermopsis nevadensis]